MRECDKKPSDTLWHGGRQWVPIRDWDRMRMLAEHYETEWGKSCSWANKKIDELTQKLPKEAAKPHDTEGG